MIFYIFPLVFGLDDILITLLVSAVVGGITSAVTRKKNNEDTIAAEERAQNYGLSNSEQQQNAFNAAEAERARQWQEDFYNQYQSPSAMIRQYQEAGLNPALMYGQGVSAPSAISSPQASGSGGASIGQSMSGIASMIGALSQARLSNAQAQNLTAKTNTEVINQKTLDARNQAALDETLSQIEKISSETNRIDSETALNSILGEKYTAEIADIYKGIDLKDVQIDYTTAQAELIKVQKLIQDNELEIQKAIKDARIKYEGAKANEMAFKAGYMSVKELYARQYGAELPNNMITGTAACLTNAITKGVFPSVKGKFDQAKNFVIDVSGKVDNVFRETVPIVKSRFRSAYMDTRGWVTEKWHHYKNRRMYRL